MYVWKIDLDWMYDKYFCTIFNTIVYVNCLAPNFLSEWTFGYRNKYLWITYYLNFGKEMKLKLIYFKNIFQNCI